MPCTYYTPQEEAELASRRYKAELDRLTAENDTLRDYLIRFLDGEEVKIPKAMQKEIRSSQVAHRKNDLKRLESVFRKERDAEKLGLVLLADPRHPLESQLGFEPDDF